MEWKVQKKKRLILETSSQQKIERTLQFWTFKRKSTYSSKFPNYNGKETQEEKEIMQNLAKEKVRAELQLNKFNKLQFK